MTLVGDAAHVTTPFVGEGVNVAMLDSVMLVRKLKDRGIGRAAVEAYEKDMFSRAKDVIERSVNSGALYFDLNAPHSLVKAGKKGDYFGGLGQD